MERATGRPALLVAVSVGWLLGRRTQSLAASPPAAIPSASSVAVSSQQEIASIAREAQLAQLDALSSLDAKAANLIAFSGIVIGLVFSSAFASRHWSLLVSVGAGFLAAATLPLALVLLLRRPRFDPAIGSLNDLFRALPLETTCHEIAVTIASAIERNEEEMTRNIRFLRAAAALIILGLIFVAASLIYSHYDHAPPANRRSHFFISS